MNEVKNWIVTLCIIALFAMTLAGLSNASVRATHFSVKASSPTKPSLTKKTFARVVGRSASTADPTPLFVDGFEGSPDLCPAGRVFETKVSHRYDMADARVLDVKRADNIFGTFVRWNPQTPFVWDQGFTVFPAVKRVQYIASRFDVPLTLPADQHGKIYKGETVPGPRNTVSISTRCGDFTFVPPFCKGSSTGPGSTILAYKLPGYAGVGCTLIQGRSYYLNIEQTDPTEQNPFCGPVTCGYTLQNNHTP